VTHIYSTAVLNRTSLLCTLIQLALCPLLNTNLQLWCLKQAAVSTSSNGDPKTLVALNPDKFQPFVLRETADLSSNTRRFRFALQSDSEQPKVLGLPCGHYVAMQFEDTGANTITRYYTPTSGDNEVSSSNIPLFPCACCSFTCSRCVAILQPLPPAYWCSSTN
jgi:Oxidoreductase FAD-binding domain